MAKLFVSKKDIIFIQEFMTNYIGKEYDGNERLTHHVMGMYLYEKGLTMVKTVNFADVRKTDLLTGKYIVVRDENHQVLVYENPKNHSLELLLNELTFQNKKRNLEKIRNTILKEKGYLHDSDGSIITTEEFQQNQYEDMLAITEKINRQKYIARKHYY